MIKFASAVRSALIGLFAAAVAIPAQAKELEPLKIGVLKVASQAPFFFGLEKGYFEEQGIAAELVYFDAAVPATVAVVSGDVDVAVIGFTGAFFNMAAQGGIKVIAGHSREAPGFRNTGIFASKAAYDAGLTSFEAMKGKSIGLTTMGSTNHYAVARIAEKYGFDLSGNRLVPAQGLGNLAAMVQGNQIDVAAGAGTGFVPLVEAGQAHLIGWAGDEVPWQIAALGVAPKTITDRRDLLERFLRAYERAAAEYKTELLQRNEDGSFKDTANSEALLEIVSKHIKIEPANLKKSLAFVDPRLDVQSIVDQIEWNRKEGFLQGQPDPAEFLDLSFVEGHENVPTSLGAK